MPRAAKSERLVFALLASLLPAALGVAINFATELKTSSIAWVVVASLVLVTFVGAYAFRAETKEVKASKLTTQIRQRTGLRGSGASDWVTEAEGLLLEDIETWPDGTRRLRRAYTADAVHAIVELRRIEVIQGRGVHDGGS